MPIPILKQTLQLLLIIGLATYLAFGIYLYFNQHKALYHPDSQDFQTCKNFADAQKITHNGTRFYYGKTPDQTSENTNLVLQKKFAILYHGNAGSACDRLLWKQILKQNNISYIIVEYSGYAGDPQPPSMKRILEDVQNINNYLKNINYDQLILIGESLGSGPAAYHSTLTMPDKILLIPAYPSIVDVAQHHYPYYPVRWMVKDNYSPQKWLNNYQNQLLIIHGVDDILLPIYLSEKLYNSIPAGNKQFVKIKLADHNNIYTAPATLDAINKFLTK